MPCLCRMSKISILGLIWLHIFSTGLYVASLEPGYLDFDNLPDTNFSCVGKVIGGYYADLEANCQMFHVCTIGQLDEPMDIRFLCLNGTVFDQETRVCERIDEVDCSKSEKFYSLNLELYGNTQPPILEEDADTESPPIEKSTFPTTTTTTTTTTPRPRTTTTMKPPQYFTSSIRTITPSSYHKIPPSHHFPIGEQHHSPQYTPEEINISLNPGAPPDIRTKSPQFPIRSYSDNVNSDNKKIVVTTDSSVFDSDDASRNPAANRLHFSSTTERNTIGYNNIHTQQPQFNFNFNYHDVDSQEFSSPQPHNYHYQNNIANFRPPGLSGNSYSDNPFRSSTHRNEYLPVTRKNYEIDRSTPTARSFFLQPIKSPSRQYFTRTEKPRENDLPAPVLPTIAPIVFSSPAPFTLGRNREAKRFTDDHELPPRIIISASASVSDASGRTLNYSLGTIGAAQLLAQPPASYDDYKEDDVVLDPFYHDVPKIQSKQKRSKRNANAKHTMSRKSQRIKRSPQNLNPSDIIKSEDEAIEVLKFLFDWYKSQEKTTKPSFNVPVSPDEITNINKEFSRSSYVTEDYADDATLERGTAHEAGIPNSDLFNGNSKYNILGNLFDTSIPRKAVIQEPITKSYETSTNRKILDDTASRPSAVYIENYEITKTPKFSEHFEHQERRNAENEYPHTTKTTYSNNRRKTNRGRHRFTVPYSSTERHRTPPNYERIYTQGTTSNPNRQNDLNGGFLYDSRYVHKTTPKQRYQNSYAQKKSRNQLNPNGKHTYYEEHQDFIASYPPTESSSAKIFEETLKQINTDQEVSSHKTTEYKESDISVTTVKPPFVDEYNENDNEQIKTVQSVQHNSATEPIYNVTEAPVSINGTFEVTLQTYNNFENSSNISVPITNTEKVNTDLYQDEAKKSDELELAFEELNRAESLKTTSQLQPKPTENYSSFDVYDYIDDNYEPITYSEEPKESIEQQLEKGEKDIGKEIVHEETHINVDFTEPSQDVSSEEHTLSASVRKTTLFESREDKDSSESYQETSSKIEDTRNSSGVNTPAFKYIDKNINSFGDILKNLRDFQVYEQNIYDYNHNLIGIKENGKQQKDHVDKEIGTTALPTTLESTTSKFKLQNEINNQTTEQNNEEITINSNIGFTNEYQENYKLNQNEEQYTDLTKYFNSITESQNQQIPTTQAPEEKEQLYTSRPFGEINEQKTYSLINLDQSESTNIYSHTSLETTIASLGGETILPLETTTLKNKIEVSTLDEMYTSKLVSDYSSTKETTVKIKSKGRSRYRLKNREHSRDRMKNQPYNLVNSGINTEKIRKNRRRQQNKPHLPKEFSITTSETPVFTILSELDTTTEQAKLDDNKVQDVRNNENGELDEKTTAALILNTSESSETTLPQHESTTDFSIDIPSSSIMTNTSTGFFITKQPKSGSIETINENHTIGTEEIPKTSLSFTTQETTETYTDTQSDGTLQSDTTTKLNGNTDSNNSTPTTYVVIIRTTENNKINEHVDKYINDYPSTIATTTPTSFAESEALSTTTTSFESLFSEDETIESTTQAPTTSQDVTTPTSHDLLETLFTDIETTTDEAVTTKSKDELYIEKYTSTTSIYDSEIKLIKKIEEATNSTVVSETAEDMSAEDDLSVNTTEQLNSESTSEADSFTDPSTESTDVTKVILGLSTESPITNYNEPTIISTYQAEHQSTSEKQEDYSTTLTTIKPVEEDTKDALESTSPFPSTKIEIITQINSATDTGVSTETTVTSQYSSTNKGSAKNNREKNLENKKGKYSNTRRTHQRLPKKKSPGYRRFSTRHRFGSNNVTPATTSFQKDNEIPHHRFDAPLATPTPTGTTEPNNLKQNLHAIDEDEASMTDDPLPKNVKPTQGDTSKKLDLSTTPLSTLYKVQLRKERVNKQFIFNCFGKPLDAFYSDPRDCRLFHYCTKGYTKNQLLDMKFVCDFGTHFDEEKLVCTTEIPKRCL